MLIFFKIEFGRVISFIVILIPSFNSAFLGCSPFDQ
jgi:hypothetical protein